MIALKLIGWRVKDAKASKVADSFRVIRLSAKKLYCAVKDTVNHLIELTTTSSLTTAC